MPLPARARAPQAAAGRRPDRQSPSASSRSARTASCRSTPRDDETAYVDQARPSPTRSPVARRLCARNGWPVIDVTRRSIEETAAAIMALLQRARRAGRQSDDALMTDHDARRSPRESAARAARLLRNAGLAVEAGAAAIDERAARGAAAPAGAAPARGRAGARRGQGARRSPRPCPAASSSAPTRCWRSAASAGHKPATAPRRRAQLRALARPDASARIRLSRWSATARVLWRQRRQRARLTMRDLVATDVLDDYLDAAGDERAAQRRRLSARRARHPAVRARSRATISPSSACRCCRCLAAPAGARRIRR